MDSNNAPQVPKKDSHQHYQQPSIIVSTSELSTTSTSAGGEDEAGTTSTHHAEAAGAPSNDKKASSTHGSFFHTCWQALVKFLQTHMAFKPPVLHDPRLYSIKRKRMILACLALGSSLNGLCSTIFVCFLLIDNSLSLISHMTFSFSCQVYRISKPNWKRPPWP
jgi:hypothetical protein